MLLRLLRHALQQRPAADLRSLQTRGTRPPPRAEPAVKLGVGSVTQSGGGGGGHPRGAVIFGQKKPHCRQAAFTPAPRTPAARKPALTHAAADGRSGGSQPAAMRRRGQAGATGGRRGHGPAAVPEAHRSERAELCGPAAASPASRAGQRQRSPCTCPR